MTQPNRVRSKQPAALVTAGGSGIGLAIARCLLESGYHVTVCDVSPDAIDAATAAEPELVGHVADVSVPEQVKQLMAAIDESRGRLDAMVNNAGIGGPRAPIDEISNTDWQRTISVNLSGAFYCTKYAARIMKPQGSGCIVNISSTSARTGLPLRAPYVASKVGLQGLTYNVARELGPFNIRCNVILPGAIDNERGRNLMVDLAARLGISVDEAEERRLSYISMRTRIDPAEVGEMVVFLCSDKARHITGQMIGVCGNSEWEG